MALIPLSRPLRAEPGDFLLVEGDEVTVIYAETARALARAIMVSDDTRHAERVPGWGDISPATEALIRQKAAVVIGDAHLRVLRSLAAAGAPITSQALVADLNAHGVPIDNSQVHADVLYPLMGRQLIERRRFQQQGGDRSKWEYRITAAGREFLIRETA